MQKLKHLVEAFALRLLFAAFRAMPLDIASYAGGFIARAVGPCLSAHKTAKKNLALAFPEKTPAERRRIVTRMWDNLGRVAAELPHLPGGKLFGRMHTEGVEHFLACEGPVLFFSGHLGNWELAYPIAFCNGIPVTLIYREANNPYVDKIIGDIRNTHATDMIPKGFKGAVKIARAIKEGRSIAMLIDQKMNDGIAAPFFGRDAMTAPAIADFALRYDMPILPVRIVRTKGAHFEGHIYPPLKIEKTGDKEKDILAIMTQINQILENWIRAHPDQWFWVHKRWPN